MSFGMENGALPGEIGLAVSVAQNLDLWLHPTDKDKPKV